MLKIIFVVSLFLFSGCLSKSSNTIEECEQKTLGERDDCYSGFSLSENDLSYCTQIIDVSKKNNCINSFP